MTVPVISKHAREIGTSPTVAGLVGKQMLFASRMMVHCCFMLYPTVLFKSEKRSTDVTIKLNNVKLDMKAHLRYFTCLYL